MSKVTRGMRVIGAVIAGATAVSCGSPFDLDRDVDAPIQTDRLEYRIEREGGFAQTELSYTYTNSTSAPWFIANCNGITLIRLEKDVDGVWTHVWGNNTPDCASPPIVVAPGASVERDLLVAGGFAGCGCAPQFAVEDLEGVYRLVLVEVWGSEVEPGVLEDKLALENRVSNRFAFDD